MSYVQKVLLPGERVIYETGLHWLIYGRAILIFAIALLLAIGSSYAPSDSANPVLIVAGVAALVGLFFFLGAAIRRASTELAVADQRVVFKHGIIARHTIEMNRSKVESVDVDQSLLGRIFGYGTVMLRGTGGSLEPMAAIADPLTFRSHITADPVRQPASASSAS
jgi:uncharacterized membrane protein YdbT with pleckstrin-like domain